MIDYMDLGSTPCDENCVQVGAPDYAEREPAASARYLAQLRRTFPQAAEYGCSFVRKAFPHDFGTYHDACIRFNGEDDRAVVFAYFVERNLPNRWNPYADPIYYLGG